MKRFGGGSVINGATPSSFLGMQNSVSYTKLISAALNWAHLSFQQP